MDTKFCSHSDSCAEEKQSVQCVESDRDDCMKGETVVEDDQKEVDEGKHREYSDKHIIVDQGRVAAVRICDHIAHKSHDEESPEELDWSQGLFC